MNGVGGCSVGAHVCIPVCVKPVVNPWNHTHTTLLDPSTTATQACARLKNLYRKDYYYNYFIKKTHFVTRLSPFRRPISQTWVDSGPMAVDSTRTQTRNQIYIIQQVPVTIEKNQFKQQWPYEPNPKEDAALLDEKWRPWIL